MGDADHGHAIGHKAKGSLKLKIMIIGVFLK
jgi:hypothetical protein